MKHKLVMSRSSYLTCLPVLVSFLILGVLSAVWGWNAVSALLLFLFLFSLCSRLWAQMSIAKLHLKFSSNKRGIFPGESMDITVTVHNDKLLPVLWMELYLPLSKKQCLIPQETREPEAWEKPALTDSDASDVLVGSSIIPGLLWKESRKEIITWSAARRGIYSADLWRLRAGDGFGLAQVDTGVENGEIFAVFPSLRDVDPSYFLRNLWNAQVGPKGVMEDLTVIRSTREYSSSDPVKKINWRLKARGLPLQVNVYEDTLPRGVHFILDGESFSGPDPHLNELEDTLSILASLAVALEDHQAHCSLSLPQGYKNEAMSVAAEEGVEALLWAMAEYDPSNPVKDDSGKTIRQRSWFSEEALFALGNAAGRNYYIVYDLKYVPRLLHKLDPSNTTILTWRDEDYDVGFETVCLRNFLSGGVE